MTDTKNITAIAKLMKQMRAEVEKGILGLPEVIHLITIALFSQGHTLLEGLPGTAKTATLLAFSKTISNGGFSRITGRPDFLPQEVLYSTDFVLADEIHNEATKGLAIKFSRGPLLVHGENLCIFFINEINRLKEKTQSVFLEAMQEFACSEGTKTHLFPYVVFFADRNPLETEETHELPEAQRDRFLFEIEIPRLSRDNRRQLILHSADFRRIQKQLDKIQPVIDIRELQEIRYFIQEKVQISPVIADYILDLVDATWNPDSLNIKIEGGTGQNEKIVRAGISPRAEVALVSAAKVAAAAEGRDYVIPLDIQKIWIPFAAHRFFLERLVLRRRAGLAKQIIREIIRKVEAPK